jgi:hypothetical protein
VTERWWWRGRDERGGGAGTSSGSTKDTVSVQQGGHIWLTATFSREQGAAGACAHGTSEDTPSTDEGISATRSTAKEGLQSTGGGLTVAAAVGGGAGEAIIAGFERGLSRTIRPPTEASDLRRASAASASAAERARDEASGLWSLSCSGALTVGGPTAALGGNDAAWPSQRGGARRRRRGQATQQARCGHMPGEPRAHPWWPMAEVRRTRGLRWRRRQGVLSLQQNQHQLPLLLPPDS